ncbi:MAG: hypothetical protein M0002_12735 [Rhodospirillales bacterium]|nr:hypothetical protein [Rhodospirillales bacterium]
MIEEAQFLLDAQPIYAMAAFRRRVQVRALPGGFEHGLALGVVEALTNENGGDRRGGPLQGSHAPVCSAAFGVQAGTRGTGCGPEDLDRQGRRTCSSFPLRQLWEAHFAVRR